MLTLLFVCVVLSPQVWAADNAKGTGMVPDDYKMESMLTDGDKSKPAHALPPLQYISPNIPLSARDKQAFKLAEDWKKVVSAPLQANGKVMYTYGASPPTVIGAPLQCQMLSSNLRESERGGCWGLSPLDVDTAQAGTPPMSSSSPWMPVSPPARSSQRIVGLIISF
jgi:hypothetical protein